MAQHYISITGLRLKRWWHGPLFWRYALPSMMQARQSHGNISAEARKIDGIHHTLTVWTSRKAMLDFVHSGTHKKAIAGFGRIATGKTYGYLADRPPSWEDLPVIYAEKGRDYSPR